MEKMFEIATRERLRFDTIRGQINVESLWQMPLTSKDEYNLDAVAKFISRTIRENSEESFVSTKSAANETLELKLDIIKYIIAYKLAEADHKSNLAAIRAKREMLTGILAEKENEALMALSPEEIRAELAKLS